MEAEAFLGTWMLRSFEILKDGVVVNRPYGDHPFGMLIYALDGHMSVQIARGPSERPRWASDDINAGTTAEKEAAADTFRSYCGTYMIDTASKTVRHQVLLSFFPNRTGTELVRSYQIDLDLPGRAKIGPQTSVAADGTGAHNADLHRHPTITLRPVTPREQGTDEVLVWEQAAPVKVVER